MNKLATVSAGLLASVVSASSFAAYTLPTTATAAFADMGDAWTAIESQLWIIIPTVVIGFFVIRMFKKGANKVG